MLPRERCSSPVTTPVIVWIRSGLRRRKWGGLGLTVLAVLASVVPLVTAAGARRTATSLERMREELRPSHLDVQFHEGVPPDGARKRLAQLPGVELVSEGASMLARPKGSVGDAFESFGQGGLDETFGRDLERARLDAGRRPHAADEVMVSARLATDLDLSVGDILVLETYTDDAVARIFRGEVVGYEGPQISLRVVGVGRQPEELTAGAGSPLPLFVVAPAFFEAWAGRVHYFRGIFHARLTDGMDGSSAFEAAAKAAFPEREDLNVHPSEESARVADAVSTSTIALGLLALAATLSGALALAQAASRFTKATAADQQILGVLGLDRRGLALGRAGLVALPVLVGALTAVALACAASGLFPTGPARRLEPEPGVRIDGPVLAVGACLFVMTALAAAAAFGRGRGAGAAVALSRAAQLAGRTTRPVAVTVGIRSAFQQSQRGQRMVPVRSAIMACAAGLAGLVASLVFAASLDRLVSEPARYGWRWDYQVGLGDEFTDDQALAHADHIIKDPRVAGALYARNGERTIGGEQVLTLGVKPLLADLSTTIVEGRTVRADDEIVLGRTTLDQLGKEVGDQLEVPATDGSIRFRIVGQSLFPTSESDDPAAGALVTLGAMGRLPGSAGNPNLYLTISPGTDTSALRRDLEEQAVFVTGAVPPSVVTNLDRVVHMPYLFAAYLGLLAAAAITHALLVGVRRRRAELAILKAIGFVRSQVGVTVLSQSVTFVVAGMIVGVPGGVAFGRVTWRLLAGGAGFAGDPSVPWVALLATAAAAPCIALLIAALPAWWASRTRPAAVLRTE